MTIGKPILKCGLALVQENKVEPKISIAKELIWREVSDHSTKLLENEDITQRLGFHGEIKQSLSKETEEVSNDKDDPEDTVGDIFKNRKSDFCTRFCLLWATLIFYPHVDSTVALMLSGKKSENFVYL